MKTKVLFLVLGLEVGGIEKYLLRFISFMDNSVETYVLCKSGRSGFLEKEYLKIGAKIKLLKIGYLSFISWIKLYYYIKNNGFDSVVDFTGDFGAIPIFIAKKAKVKKRIIFYRGSRYQFNQTIIKNIYTEFLKLIINKYATKILSNSKSGLNYFHPNWEKSNKFKVIYNGIPEIIPHNKNDKFVNKLNLSLNSFVIGHVGRYALPKNHAAIFQIAEILVNKYDNVYFLLCGKGVEKALKNKITDKKVLKKCITPGICENVFEYHKYMDVFIFPSINEGQPNALLEAMISGVPIVASNIDSIKESVPNYMHNFLCDPSDINSFIQQIELWMNGFQVYDVFQLQDWSKNKFNAKKNFQEFLEELV